MYKKFLFILFFFTLVIGCVTDKDFDSPKDNCTELTINATFADLENSTTGEVVKVLDPIILEGYVVSSDIENNFFGTIHIQDKAENPTIGIQFLVDTRDYHLNYRNGEKVSIKLKDLYLAKKNDNYVIGGVFTSFGNKSVGRLPSLQVKEHLFSSCNSAIAKATKISITNLKDYMVNTLVEIENLEFIEEELDLTFAEAKEETERTLKDCLGNQIKLVNSGYSNFADNILPTNNGSVTAVLIKDKNEFKLQIRSLSDLNFANDRCPPIVTEFTSTAIFISEIADPDNNAGARFIELYNYSNEPLDLNNWKLNRYTNASTEISASIDLSGYIISAKSTLVISPNATEFASVYGFIPDVSVSTNSPADSNGDDNLELVDPFGEVIDIFGIIGEDGSNTNHEFEDGKAARKESVTKSNSSFTFNEWIIFNDTGENGTFKTPQIAPTDFTPGIR
ncbi:DUF5689 domain-containing protein [Cellulophaga sp. 20_2_10]|uniref:DUF5689 domain-containing protein n=1 Tax=Cellulophaga sp. 20_2_10 TaxID=2942476 RepID=UPI00201A732D|nr:DUF5689 domain-containing protein [Cellulophaga sp. 20_2_10]MCL5246334.1 DUF5689 domain-containing protein [Cellulophaga sp. 20_2_10]